MAFLVALIQRSNNNLASGSWSRPSRAEGKRVVYDSVMMRDVRDRGGKRCVTSWKSRLRQGLARELWMITLVHYTGLYGTARIAQATENNVDLGLPQPLSPPTAPGTDGCAPSM